MGEAWIGPTYCSLIFKARLVQATFRGSVLE